jgi:hypothetical protein
VRRAGTPRVTPLKVMRGHFRPEAVAASSDLLPWWHGKREDGPKAAIRGENRTNFKTISIAPLTRG